MFAAEYQGGTHVEVLTTQGQNPLAHWKVSGPQKGVQKTYDKALKGYVFVCSAGCKLALPRDERSALGLTQPHLLLQLQIGTGGPFSLELGWTDAGGTRRRILLSSSFSELKTTLLHCQVPLASVPRGCWLNLSLPLAELVPALFRGAGGGGGAGGAGGAAGGGGGSSSVFRSLDALQVAGGCQLRRVCTLREAPQRMECGPDGAAPKPLDFPSGVEYATITLDPRSLAFTACGCSSNCSGGASALRLSASLQLGSLHGGAGGGGGGSGSGAGGGSQAGGGGGHGGGGDGGGFGVVGTTAGTRRPAGLSVAVSPTSVGSGLHGSVVPLLVNGRLHAGAKAAAGGAGGVVSDEERGEDAGAKEADGHGGGALSSYGSGGLSSCTAGALSGPTTPTGRSGGSGGSGGPPSPWAISRGGEHGVPSRLGRTPGNSNPSILPPNGGHPHPHQHHHPSGTSHPFSPTPPSGSLLPPAPGASGRPPRSQSSATGPPHATPAGGEDPSAPVDVSSFGGRRAISAQTTVRGTSGGGASGFPEIPGASGGGAPATGGPAPSGKPRSPPWPRSVFSQRAQSGPARLSVEKGLGETQAPSDMPMSPSLVPRPGRRGYGPSNLPPTIIEHESLPPSSGGAGTPSIRSPNRSPARGRPIAVPRSSAVAAAISAAANSATEPPHSPGMLLPLLRPVRTDGPMSPTGGGAGGVRLSVGSPFAPLSTLLTVKGGMEASVDLGPGHNTIDQTPCSPSFLTSARINSLAHAHRYGNSATAGGAATGTANGGGPGGDSSDSDGDAYARIPATVPRTKPKPMVPAAVLEPPAGRTHSAAGSTRAVAAAAAGAQAGAGGGVAGTGAEGAQRATPTAWAGDDATPKRSGAAGPGAAGAGGRAGSSQGSARPSPGGTPTKAAGAGAGAAARFAQVASPTRGKQGEGGPGTAATAGAGAGAGAVDATGGLGSPGPKTGVGSTRPVNGKHPPSPGMKARPGSGVKVSSPARAQRNSPAAVRQGAAAAVAAGDAGPHSHPHAPTPPRAGAPSGARSGIGAGGRGAAGAAGGVPGSPAARLPPLSGGGGGAAGTGPPGVPGAGRPRRAVRGGHLARSTTSSQPDEVGDVDESVTLNAGLWGGFGVDEEDDMLGSRHFRDQQQQGGAGAGSDLEGCGSPGPYGAGGGEGPWSAKARAEVTVPSGPSLSHGIGELELGDDVGEVPASPTLPTGGRHGHGQGAVWPPVGAGLGHGEELASPPLLARAAANAPLSPPIRRSGTRTGVLPDAAGGGMTHESPAFAGFFAHRTSADVSGLDDGQGYGSGPADALLVSDPQLHAMLDEEALLAGVHRHVDEYGMYDMDDWANVDKRPTPLELRNDHRAFTPPVVPASKALGVSLPPGAEAHHNPARGRGAGAAAAGRKGGAAAGVASAQVLRVGPGGSATVVNPQEGGEPTLDLVYDPVLNCYYDSASGQYYELKS